MKHSTKTLLCVLCAAAAALCVIFAIFTLTKKQSASSASSATASSSAASSAPAVSEYGTVDSFDYQNFTYSDGLDANGYRTGITAQDYVTLPDNVAALPIKKADVTPSDSDVQARIDSLLSQYSTTQAVTDRAAQNGDVVNIDYSGTVDGVAFNGGTYQATTSRWQRQLHPRLEDQIVGHNTGDTFDVTVTFPDGYDASTDSDGNTVELSGKEAVFRVTVNSISEPVTPELTDDGWTAPSVPATTCTPWRRCAPTSPMRCMTRIWRMPSWTACWTTPLLRICPARCPATTPACS